MPDKDKVRKEDILKTGSETDKSTETPVETEETQETVLESSSGAGEGEAENPSEVGRRGRKKSKHHQERKLLHRTEKIRDKYKDFSMKNSLNTEELREERSKEIQADRAEMTGNTETVSRLREEAREGSDRNRSKREKLAEDLQNATQDAKRNMDQAKLDIMDAREKQHIIGLYDDAYTILTNFQNDSNRFMTIARQAELIREVRRLEGEALKIPSMDHLLPKTGAMRQRFFETLGELVQEKERFSKKMGVDKTAAAEKLARKQEGAKELTEKLNSEYNERSPLVRLIRKAKKVENLTGEAPEEGTSAEGVLSFIDEHITGAATDVIDNALSLKFTEEGDNRGSLIGGIQTGILALLGKKSVSEAAEADTQSMDFFNWFSPVLKAVLLCMHIKEYLGTKGDMSGGEKVDGVEGLAGESVDAVIAGAQGVLTSLDSFGVLKEIPILGPIFGLISNAVGAAIKARNWHRLAGLRDEDSRRKAEIKEKMAIKRAKYEAKGVSTDDGQTLLGFMGTETVKTGIFSRKEEEKSHIAKDKDYEKEKTSTKGYTTSVEAQHSELEKNLGSRNGVNIYESIAALKKKKNEVGLGKAEESKYYQLKSLKLIQEYRELKEAKYVNEKRIRNSKKELIHIGIDAVKNIVQFMPGWGNVASAIIGLGNTAAQYGEKLFTKAKQKFRDKGHGDQTKTTTAKGYKRGGFANDIFNQMTFVGEYMNPEAEAGTKGTFADLEPATGDMVKKRVDYLDAITGTLGYSFVQMYQAETKTQLLDKMASAFGTER